MRGVNVHEVTKIQDRRHSLLLRVERAMVIVCRTGADSCQAVRLQTGEGRARVLGRAWSRRSKLYLTAL